MKVIHDGSFDLATGASRHAKTWKNAQWSWAYLVEKLSVTHRTAETFAEYMAAPKSRQDEIKDIGGFVGGYLTGGRRKNKTVAHRQLVTLDIDFGTMGVWEDFKIQYDCAALVYSTHKHSAAAPRLRLIIPLDREVFVDEYEAICRRLAGNMDINVFSDITTFRPSQLMYWPSTPVDGEFFFDLQDGPWLSADEILATYHNWRDSSEYPVGLQEKEKVVRDIKKQEDPLEKKGIVGAFCRTYDMHQVITELLSAQYVHTDDENRYTYLGGSTAGGLVVYEDKFAFSHHGSDPTSGKLSNAFDLCRVHLYGDRDDDAREDTPPNRMPSYLAMSEFCTGIPAVRQRVVTERLEQAAADFGGAYEESAGDTPAAEEDLTWMSQLKVDTKAGILSTIENAVLILENDQRLKGAIAYDDFEKQDVALRSLPWRKVTKETRYLTDTDDANMWNYFEALYKIAVTGKIEAAMRIVAHRHKFHPVRDYLTSLKWDGIERVETLFIDYLGAEDSKYIRTITRKDLVAGVARIMKPGIKFDETIILCGPEGVGKSTILARLGGPWFSDSFSFSMLGSKQAEEQVQGVWIMEIPEMNGLKKSETTAGKAFLSRQTDRFRVSYGKRVEHFPRQILTIGTSNEDNPLKGHMNRRFWPILTMAQRPTKSVFDDFTEAQVAQVWAEAVELYNGGEDLYLDDAMKLEAKQRQQAFSETDEREGMIRDFLETLLPAEWDKWSLTERQVWLVSDVSIRVTGTRYRDRVCVAEIWCELMGNEAAGMTAYNTRFIHEILAGMSDWKRAKSGTHRFPIYGTQRVYIRTEGDVYKFSPDVNGVNAN